MTGARRVCVLSVLIHIYYIVIANELHNISTPCYARSFILLYIMVIISCIVLYTAHTRTHAIIMCVSRDWKLVSTKTDFLVVVFLSILGLSFHFHYHHR